ncbi:unnamed protein product, partial [Ectocarpus fasciculatus]
MNLELVARMARVELTVSPPLLSALADFAHSSKVLTPGLLLPARSPDLDNLRVLAAGCRACSTKGHVSDVLHARGTKDVDVRAAGFAIRFELDPPLSSATSAVRPRSPSGRSGVGGLPSGVRAEDHAGGPFVAETADAGEASARTSPHTCLELTVGCCIYQKGRYLLGHAEGGESTTGSPRLPPLASSSSSRGPPPPPPSALQEKTGKEVGAGSGDDREEVLKHGEKRTGYGYGSSAPGGAGGTQRLSPPQTPTSAAKPVDGTGQAATPHEGARETHWGGGPGPRPCEGALAIVQSLRVPLSDPHYFRVADLSLSLDVTEEGPGKDAGEEEPVQQRRRGGRTPVVLGGQENTDDGWTGELLVTRCAVVGNPRQPGTRADAMLSRIRVEVSKEAVAAITLLTLSFKRAVSVPPAPWPPAFSRGLSREGMEDCIPTPQILSPPWGVGPRDNATRRGRRGDRAMSPRSVASAASATTGVGTGVANNWSGAVPLPRLALLSGLTTLRLNVSLAGVQARVLSRGLRNDDVDPSSDDGQHKSNAEGPHPQGVTLTPSSAKDSRRHSGARAERARRCVRRLARQLVERVHPAAASTGYRQACRLFRDEMGALGYDQGSLDGVVEALLETTARIRDPAAAGQEESGKEAAFFQYPASMPGQSGHTQQQETKMPGRATVEEADAPGERADVRELIEAGMSVLSDPSVPANGGSGSGGDGAVGEEPVLLDIAVVEASGLTLALTRLTYDTRFTTTAEAIVVRDSDGIRILSAGRIGLGDGGDDGKRSAGNGGTSKGFGDDATIAEGAMGNKKSSVPGRASASRLKRHQARRGQERDATSAREKIEAAAATLAENQKRETSALLISFVACDKRHIFGSGGDSPHVVAAVGRLAASASRGSAPPPEPGLLECLSRDRERRASVSIDQISFVAAPSGFLTAARAATSLEAAAAEAAAALARPAQDDGFTPPGSEKRVLAASRRPSAPVVLRPSVSTSVHLQVREFRSLLSLESRPLASLSMAGLVFEASRSEWWDLDDINPGIFRDLEEANAATSPRPEESAGVAAESTSMPTAGWPGWTRDGGRHRTALGYLRASLQGLELLDLTTDGQLHNQVISHEGAPGGAAASPATANAAAPPAAAAAAAAAADHRASSSASREINASVRGLRVCFLHRFVAEVVKYFGPDRLGPVFAEVRRFGGGGGAVDAAGSEAENESVAVVMGEEDQAVPDKWSVVGSEDGGDGNSRTERGGGGAVSRDARAGTPVSDGAGGGGVGGGGKAEAETGMRVTAVLQNLTVVIPRSTHSREAAAAKCEELVLEVRKKRGTWRLPVDTTNVASRRLERETRRGHRSPGPKPAAAASSSPHGGGANGGEGDASAAAGDAPPPPALGGGKLGVRPPPPIFIPRVSRSLLSSRLLPPQEHGTGTVAASAEAPRGRLSGDAPGRVEESLDGTGHRGSVASTRRSILSFVSARSFRSVGDVAGEDDGFDLYPPDVDDMATGEGSGSASGTDSDLDEFFDAMAEVDEAAIATEFFPTEEHRYPSPMFFQQGVDTSGAASPPLGGQLFAEDVRTHIPRAWAVDDDEDYANAEQRPTREHPEHTGARGDDDDDPENGGSGVADGVGAGESSATATATASAIERERNASVLRIAVHLKGAQLLVALAPRLDTPTTTAAAAAAAAAATAATAAAAAASSTAEPQREAKAFRGYTSAADGAGYAAGEAGEDELLDEGAHSQDAEVLPRAWHMANGAPVYLRKHTMMARERSGGSGGVNSPGSRRDDEIRRTRSSSSAGPRAGSSYANLNARGGRDGTLPVHVEQGWRPRDGGGYDRSARDPRRLGPRFNRGSSAGVGASGHGNDREELFWSDRGEGQQQLLRWREITQQPFDLMLLVDTGKELGHSRILLTMPEYGVEEEDRARSEGRKPGGLYICPTMAEYYLLLSVYFDNYCELDCFYGPPGPGESPGAPAAPVAEDWPPYGTPSMVQRVLTRPENWNFSISIPLLEASLSMDTRYFPERPASMWMAQTPQNPPGSEPMMEDYWEDPRERVPFACMRLVNPAMSITAGLGILRLAVAAGDVAVMDTRQPIRTRYPVVLHAGPMSPLPESAENARQEDEGGQGAGGGGHENKGTGRRDPLSPQFADASPATCVQAFVDDAFGYFRPGGEVGSPLPLPVQVSLIMTAPDMWLCVNVGVDGVDINAKEMSVVWLIVDFFSNYHRSD